MLRYGFYNSVNGDRIYEADDMGRLFNGIIKDGVFYSIGNKFRVTPAGNMYISVGTGRAWFNGTWSDLDAEMLFEVPTNSVPRTYYVTLIIDKRIGTAQRKNSIELLTIQEWNAKQDTANLYTYRLATIDVPANVTVIQSSMIANHVGGDAEPVIPWVIGAVQSLDLSSEITYWESQMNDAIDTAISNYFSGMVVAQTPADLGGGYATCSTASATLAKTAVISGFIPTDGGIFCIKFTEDVPSYATLNISDGESWTGAKEIHHKNARIGSGVITANRIGTFVYDETSDVYRLISVDDAEAGGSTSIAYVAYQSITNLQADITPEIIYRALVTNSQPIWYALRDSVTKSIYWLTKVPTSSSQADFIGIDYGNHSIVSATMNSSGAITLNSTSYTGSTPTWNDVKPSNGVSKTDLATDVQDSLDNADSALQPDDAALVLSLTLVGSTVTLNSSPANLIALCSGQEKIYFLLGTISFNPSDVDTVNNTVSLSAVKDGVIYEVTLAQASSTTMSGTLVTKDLADYQLKPTVTTVTGNTPTIATAADNTVYDCTGTAITAVTVTSYSYGVEFSLIFDSPAGATAPTLDLDGRITMPDDFEVEANKHYEINVDFKGYATVQAWTLVD